MRRRVAIANRHRGGLWWRVPLALLAWASVSAPFVAAAAVYWVVRDYTRDLPTAPDLDAWERTLPESNLLRARDGTILARLPFRDGEEVGHRRFRSIDEVPTTLVQAFLAAEDVRFASHPGVDLRAVARAARANYQAGHVVEGASTITQQLARGLLPRALGNERSLRRKVREAVVALRLERRYDKRRLLEAYMNFVFLGANAYGVDAAAHAYFGKEPSALELAESALIAGLAQAPGRADPYKDRDAALERRNDVLGRMAGAGFISAEAAATAQGLPIVLAPDPERYGTVAGWHTERVRQELERELPRAYRRGGLEVVTTAEPVLSMSAEDEARRWLDKRWREGERPEVGALVWDHVTGYVEATIGGTSFAKTRFDRSMQACRQPGSAFKPLVYAAALERDVLTPGTPLRDAPIAEFDWDLEVHWKPKNSGHSFRGVVLAVDALASSLNAPAVDVFDRAGADAVIDLARRMGITTALTRVRPLALGSSCVIPFELARFYASVAENGVRVPARFAISVARAGELLVDRASPYDPYLRPDRALDRLVADIAPRESILDARTAFLTRWMLRAVVERGTAVAARRLARPVAGKTGTTNDNTDAWFVGFSPRVVAAVWLGHDDPARRLGPGNDGGHAALPLWMTLLTLADGERTGAELVSEPPEGIVRARVDRDTGALAGPGSGGGLEVYFKSGSEPTESVAGERVPLDLHRATRDF